MFYRCENNFWKVFKLSKSLIINVLNQLNNIDKVVKSVNSQIKMGFKTA